MKIVFEDDHILVVDKPAGTVVNRAETIEGPTLQDETHEYLTKVLVKGSDPDIGGRAGIVHRLDRETSGLLIVAKTKSAFEFLQKEFAERRVNKEYTALVHGDVREKEGTVEAKIGRIGKFGKFGVIKERYRKVELGGWGADGKPSFAKASEGKESKTDYKVEGYYKFDDERFNELIFSSKSYPTTQSHSRLDRESSMLERVSRKLEIDSRISARDGPAFGGRGNDMREDGHLTKNRINYLKHHALDYTYLSVFPKTGRTHQIRVHLKSIGHPVVSDSIYAPSKLLKFDLTWCPRLFLHASSVEFVHPQTRRRVSFKSDLPDDLVQALKCLTINS